MTIDTDKLLTAGRRGVGGAPEGADLLLAARLAAQGAGCPVRVAR